MGGSQSVNEDYTLARSAFNSKEFKILQDVFKRLSLNANFITHDQLLVNKKKKNVSQAIANVNIVITGLLIIGIILESSE